MWQKPASISIVVNIWSGSKKLIKVVLRQERILVLGQLWWKVLNNFKFLLTHLRKWRFNESWLVKRFIKRSDSNERVNDESDSATPSTPSVGRDYRHTHTHRAMAENAGLENHRIKSFKNKGRDVEVSPPETLDSGFYFSSVSSLWVAVVLVLWCRIGAGVCGSSKSIMRSGRGLDRGLFKQICLQYSPAHRGLHTGLSRYSALFSRVTSRRVCLVGWFSGSAVHFSF